MKLLSIISILFFSVAAQSKDIQLQGTFLLTLPGSKINEMKTTQRPLKTIALLKYRLSNRANNFLHKNVLEAQKIKTYLAQVPNFPSQIQLDMNNVPVLDQGVHGSCVTFANTAAIDAVIGKGDYISQSCILQLGNYLERNSFAISGWNTFDDWLFFSRIFEHGIISKEKQAQYGCGGLVEYPTEDEETPKGMMSVEEYHQMAEPVPIGHLPILDFTRSTTDSEANRFDRGEVIKEIKLALNQKQRVTLGVMIPVPQDGIAGAVGKHHSENDSWIITPEILHDLMLDHSVIGGHDMIITGYDDNGVAIDAKGHEHYGLFTLRNSWGTQFGNKGDFYMSYDYLLATMLALNQIIPDDSLIDIMNNLNDPRPGSW